MTTDFASPRATTAPEARTGHRFVAGVAFAGFAAALDWISLAIELRRSLSISFAEGKGLAEALFLYLRFFTILTNIGLATLLSVSAYRLATHRVLPPVRLFNAALIYILVTCVTYEIMLRSRWSPHGLQLFTDAVIHDVMPILTLVFWLAFAPRFGARWRDALWVLPFPAAYFAMTLVAGVLGEGYPYSFLNVDKIGISGVLVTAAVFLAVFYGLGLMTTAMSMFLGRMRRPHADPAGGSR